jgi:predicted nuclease with TOPRIM domain
MDHSTLFTLADELKRLRDLKADLEAQVKDVTAQIDKTDYRLSELMAETETQNFTHAGTMFCLTTKTRASAATDCKDALYAALRAQGYGDLVYETVNANSLSSFVKEQIEENGDALPAWLMGLVNVFDKVTVGVRKAAKS